MKDYISLAGIFALKVFKIIDGKKILVLDYKEKNKIVNLGKEKILKLMVNDGTNNYINQIGFGDGTDAPNVTDTDLTNKYIKAIDSYSIDTSENKLIISWNLSSSEAVGLKISEFGLFCAEGTLFSRKTRAGILKQSDTVFEGEWTIKIL